MGIKRATFCALSGKALLSAGTFGIGAALGVAAGGWFAVVSGAGAPGVQALDLRDDVLVIPALSGIVAFVCYLLASAVIGFARDRMRTSPKSDGREGRIPN